ncbi:hypothetical protein AAIR98_000910 [Elusimicrobium simillimum]|uniref:phage baseplate protein n=1 Tax=Elusimicrobium simillimum TaxID=3143438 RepID=UPI003C704F24
MIDLARILNNPLANKISNLVEFTDFASTFLDKYLVQPETDSGLSDGVNGFLFDIKGEEFIDLNSDITDHYVENNSAMQDHIALKPETITLTGYVAELKNTPPPGLEFISQEVEKLQTLTPFLPQLTTQAQAIYNETERQYRVYQKANESVNNTWDSFQKLLAGRSIQGDAAITSQRDAFLFFYTSWQSRQLFTIHTPWGVFTQMAILNLRAKQDEDTKMISSFEITFKKIRWAEAITNTSLKIQGRAKVQSQKQVDKGVKKYKQSTLFQGSRGTADVLDKWMGGS